MSEHLFDFLNRASASPRWLLKMQRHRMRPKKRYPRYANRDTYERSELRAFRPGRLVPTPSTENEVQSTVLAIYSRLAEIAKVEGDMISYFPNFEQEVQELGVKLMRYAKEGDFATSVHAVGAVQGLVKFAAAHEAIMEHVRQINQSLDEMRDIVGD